MTRLFALLVTLSLLGACGAKDDLAEPPVPLGDFVLGLNVVIADEAGKVPISRSATPEEWEAAMKQAVEDRFGRYQGSRIYNIGIKIDGYALAPPGIPVVAAPKSVLAITANFFDDATQTRMHSEGKQIIVFESFSGDTIIGTGITRTKAEQMAALSYNAVKAVERWLLQNPEWFDLDPAVAAAALAASDAPPLATLPTDAPAEVPATPTPVASPPAPVATPTPVAPARVQPPAAAPAASGQPPRRVLPPDLLSPPAN
jgi:hypothetical protein